MNYYVARAVRDGKVSFYLEGGVEHQQRNESHSDVIRYTVQ